MCRMHLFDFLEFENFTPPYVQEMAEEGRFIPLKNIRNQIEIDKIITDIDPLLHFNSASRSRITRHCISEILRNVVEHAHANDGAFFCVQLYKTAKDRKVSFCVADCGIGLRGSFGASVKDNTEALRKSLEAGISASTYKGSPTDEEVFRSIGADNAGAGLFFTRAIAKISSGPFLAWSGKNCYRSVGTMDEERWEISHDAFEDPHRFFNNIPDWNGTVIAIDIFVDKIRNASGLFKWIGEKFYQPDKKEIKINFT